MYDFLIFRRASELLPRRKYSIESGFSLGLHMFAKFGKERVFRNGNSLYIKFNAAQCDFNKVFDN